MHDAATSMPPQAPSTWADYLAGYRWRGQGEGCSAATVHRLEAARRPTLFVKQEVLSAHAELPAEIARLRWLHGAGIDCPQVLNETQSDGRQWLLMSAMPGDTLSALAQRDELEPERLVRLVAAALRRLHDLDPAACPFDHRLERRLDTVRQRVEAGLVDELIVYIAPKLLGNAARGLCALPGLEELSQAPHFKFNEIRQVGPDVCLHLTTA